jgi:nitronate monooxygenase
MRTWLTERFGLALPVVGAPMAGVAAGRLAAAISQAGALGMFGAGSAATPEWIREQAGIAAAPGRPFGIGLMAWALAQQPAQLDAAIAAGPALVSVSYGDYPQYVAAIQDAGIAVATQVGTLAEAVAAEVAGVDVIVARGGEGGGHGRNDVGTLPLLQLVLDTVGTPVLAAGGIGSARGLAAVLAAGAAGAWVGTAFLACEESDLSAAARQQLFAAAETDTAYGRVFDVAQRLAWPQVYGGRALRNQFFDRWSGQEDQLGSDDEAAAQLRAARKAGDFASAYLYAGQGVGLLSARQSAAAVVAELAGAARLLRAAGSVAEPLVEVERGPAQPE